MQVPGYWSEVFTEDSKPASYFKHDIVRTYISLTRDDAEHVRVNQEVLAKFAVWLMTSSTHSLK
jgi:hypothetical protein